MLKGVPHCQYLPLLWSYASVLQEFPRQSRATSPSLLERPSHSALSRIIHCSPFKSILWGSTRQTPMVLVNSRIAHIPTRPLVPILWLILQVSTRTIRMGPIPFARFSEMSVELSWRIQTASPLPGHESLPAQEHDPAPRYTENRRVDPILHPLPEWLHPILEGSLTEEDIADHTPLPLQLLARPVTMP